MADIDEKTLEELKKRMLGRYEFAEFLRDAIIKDCDEMFNRDTIRAKARQLGISFI